LWHNRFNGSKHALEGLVADLLQKQRSRSRYNSAMLSFKQYDALSFFQCLYLRTNGRGCHLKFLGGSFATAETSRRFENSEA
jgi:hypothetical protein